MKDNITYGQLYGLLLELGFEDISVKASHAGFRHEPTNTTVLLAVHKADEPAREIDVLRTRRLLDGKEIIDADAFDQRIADAPLRPAAG